MQALSDRDASSDAQLQNELEMSLRGGEDVQTSGTDAHVSGTWSEPPLLKPVLTHLNADSSWLLSLPVPSHPTSGPRTSISTHNSLPRPSLNSTTRRTKRYYHILIDPWLSGSQTDISPLLSTQWHAVTPAYQTAGDLRGLVDRLEAEAEAEVGVGGAVGREDNQLENGKRKSHADPNDQEDPDVQKRLQHVEADTMGRDEGKEATVMEDLDRGDTSDLDAVVISFEFTDHMHRETLLGVGKEVPVFATAVRTLERISLLSGSCSILPESSFALPRRWSGVSLTVSGGQTRWHGWALICALRLGLVCGDARC